MIRLEKSGKCLWAAATFALAFTLLSCQHEAVIEPQSKTPVVKPVDQPAVQDDDEDAPPKNGHGGS